MSRMSVKETYFVYISSGLRAEQHVTAALIEGEEFSVNGVLLDLDFRLPQDLPRMIQASLAQLPVLALRAYVRKVIDQFYIDYRASVAVEIVDYLVSPEIVYEYVAVGQSRDE